MRKLKLNKGLLFPLILLLLLYSFLHLAHEVIVEKEGWFDESVERFLSIHRTPSLTHLFTTITFLGSSYFLLPAYILIVIIQFSINRYRALFIAAIGIISSITLFGAKYFFHRVRPSYPIAGAVEGYSFPSGHTMSTLIFFGLMIYLVSHSRGSKPLRFSVCVLLTIICLLVGCSRIYLGVHFASDVIAGYCLGVFYLLIAYKMLLSRESKIKLQEQANNQS